MVDFSGQRSDKWSRLFKKCAAQRLFLPQLLPQVERIIYVDVDIIFLSQPLNLWLHFEHFNAEQVAGCVSEAVSPRLDWYPRFAKHPFYGPSGLNSGVMLLDLQRLRQSKVSWESAINLILNKWERLLTWGDQDIINIFFSEHENMHYDGLDCRWNYRPDYCLYGGTRQHCPSSGDGVYVFHGSRGVFFNRKGDSNVRTANIQPAFRVGPVNDFL
jgi:UDP-xylose:glucoside alpha-1,3-xylosyltransferase